jgi:hypothetical protein
MKNIYYKIINRLLKESLNTRLNIEKDKWYDLNDIDDDKKDLAKKDIIDIVKKSYSYIGGHPWLQKPDDLDWYDNIDLIDLDEDDEIDATTIGRSTVHGVKMAAGASDGSEKGKNSYITKRIAELNGPKNYWGESSGAIANILLKKGLKTINDEKKVKELVGNDIVWYGDCPVDHPSFHGKVPETFKNAKGWYERKIGDEKHMKLIFGNPK